MAEAFAAADPPLSVALLLTAVLTSAASARDLGEIKARGTLRALMTSEDYPEWFSPKSGPDPGFERELLEGFAQLHRHDHAGSRFPSGSSRRRSPVAAKIALAMAGATGGTPGSPTPAGAASPSTRWTWMLRGTSPMRTSG